MGGTEDDKGKAAPREGEGRQNSGRGGGAAGREKKRERGPGEGRGRGEPKRQGGRQKGKNRRKSNRGGRDDGKEKTEGRQQTGEKPQRSRRTRRAPAKTRIRGEQSLRKENIREASRAVGSAPQTEKVQVHVTIMHQDERHEHNSKIRRVGTRLSERLPTERRQWPGPKKRRTNQKETY
ncbi:hypothetical protein HNY73_000352 [Argiope bruennichi]|uniref:Uncharacterized protein n=1 Tax=Argiope bruennichi TaxID=94029 RepID=A0A8T0G074_ARGBR|nr:hypothetical protein HNY73_000352 [Argiope bruennichi]